MGASYDLVIRGGTIFDGLGGKPYESDIAVSGGRIAAIGKVAGAGAEEIDARGKMVTPGFVDVHTHYDGQATWENRLVPSSAHGVTTAIIGNCGVGFAPCRPSQHELLIRLMEGVEDIPHPVLVKGLAWNWESYADYLNVLGGRRYDMDVGGYVPHSALRVYVMGQRAVDLEDATDTDLAQMAALLKESIKAGAMGLGSSRTMFHRSSDGKPIPTRTASEAELTALVMAMKEAGGGVFQLAGDFTNDPAEAFAMLRRLGEKSGRPITFTMGTPNQGPYIWPDMLKWLEAANDAGVTMKGQALPRAIGINLGHELTLNPFYRTDSYMALADLPFEQKIAELRKPELRARIIDEPLADNPANMLAKSICNYNFMFELGDPPNYEQPRENSIAARAERMGVRPAELAYDLMLERGGKNALYLAMANFAEGKLDVTGTLLRHRDVVPGLGDGGAHCGTICDGSYSTFMLTHWTRDRAGDRLPLEFAIHALCKKTSEIVGLNDRGVLKPGYKADLNIIDFARLRLHTPELHDDLPAGGRRLVQAADGFAATIVSGVPVYRDGQPTGALPGRLVRGQQGAPG